MIMFWSVELFCWVDERVHFCAGSEDVKVGDVEYLESVHDWFGVGSRGYVRDEAYNLFLCSDQFLQVRFVGFV